MLNTYSTTELYPQPDLNVSRIVDKMLGTLEGQMSVLLQMKIHLENQPHCDHRLSRQLHGSVDSNYSNASHPLLT